MDTVNHLGDILGLWAHPDDETFCCGGLAALASSNGQRVGCITATRGEAGVYHPEKWSKEKIGQIRTLELSAAQSILGINEHYWLDFADGGCAQVSDEKALTKIRAIVKEFRPNTIVTFAPNGLTGHGDHRAVSRWATLVARQVDFRVRVLYAVVSEDAYKRHLRDMDKELNIFFDVDEPDLYASDECYLALRLSKDLRRQKGKALRAMPSQTLDMLENFSIDQVCQAFGDEYFVLSGNEHRL